MRGMNKLPLAKRTQILTLLCEGMSMRSIERTVGCSINTVDKLLRDAGEAALAYHDEHVRGVKAQRVNATKFGASSRSTEKSAGSTHATDPTVGDCWTWTAIDADHKLLLSYLVGGRDAEYAMMLMDDLRGRLANRVQLTTDGHGPYLHAVEEAFGSDIDYSVLIKLYGAPPVAAEAARRYSPTECSGRARTRSPATPIRSMSARLTSSGRTSRCGWRCGGSPGSPTLSRRSSKTTRIWSRSMRSGTISSASTKHFG